MLLLDGQAPRDAVRRLRGDVALALPYHAHQNLAGSCPLSKLFEQRGMREQALWGSFETRIVTEQPVVGGQGVAAPAAGFVDLGEQEQRARARVIVGGHRQLRLGARLVGSARLEQCLSEL